MCKVFCGLVTALGVRELYLRIYNPQGQGTVTLRLLSFQSGGTASKTYKPTNDPPINCIKLKFNSLSLPAGHDKLGVFIENSAIHIN